MRIQKIRFKNLNSLAGIWEFDLTGEAYTADGIFAITGPTGSGKTTILDAICLALYGCTPRLKTISKSTNEIMHRRAADCSAEVEIATADGIYRCTWAQERARGKPDGALQTPHHEIADVLTGEILTTRKREVPKRVEEITGMDYDRFTRSVMLAQGDFAAFLNASPDERSPLLEQITGTEIYSKISVAVHIRRREEQNALKVLEAEGSGINLLSDEETAALREEEATLIQNGDRLQEDIRQCRTGISWHQEGARIARAIAETEREESNWTEERAAAEERLARLRKGEAAAAQEGPYRRVTTLREGQENDKTSLREIETVLPDRKAAVCRAEDAVSLQKKSLTKVQERADQAAPIIREVRDLEQKLQYGADRLLEVADAQERADQDWGSACRDLHRGADEGVSSPEETEVSEWFLTNKGIAGDPSSLFAEIRNLTKELTAADPGDAARPMPTEVAEKCTIADTKIAALQQSLMQIPWYSDPATLRAEINASQGQKTRLTLLRDRLSDDEDDVQKSRNLTIRLNENREEYTKFHQKLEGCIRERERQELLTEQMEKNGLLAARVHDLETERSHLRAGESCPLCGSKVHPYADETAVLPRAADEELKQERSALTALRKKEAALHEATTRCESELKATQEALDEIQVLTAHRKEAWAEGCRACGLNPDTPESDKMVHGALEKADGALRHYDTADTAIRTLKDGLRATETLITHCRQAVLRFGDAQRCSVHSAKIQAELSEIREKRQELLPDMSPDEAEEQFARMIRTEKEKLETAQTNHQKKVQEIAGLEGTIQTLQDSIKRQEEELKGTERQFHEAVCNAGFFGEEDFAAALLKPEEKDALKSEKERLDRWESGISTRREIARKEAEMHRSHTGAKKDAETLTEELRALTAAEQESNTRRGEIRQQLRREEEEKARYFEQEARITAQRAETVRWDELHALIGSADGKKFRNFAQGLTFEVMIASANRQLQAMSDRYLLVQNPEQPLELAVTDNYQGGTIRSTRNLSGGESFLVSLALALGLASMASGKIRVDSLFLDEGFGTLDGDALEMALSTLSSLRDQGKIIGVISHVPALNERIGTVIRVKKESGGRSTVKGPGVTRHGLMQLL